MPSAAATVVDAERARDASHRRLGGRRVEAGSPAQEVGGIEEPQHHIGVGDGGVTAPAPIAGGARHRARALGAHVQDAAHVHRRDGAAARSQRVNVDARQRHLAAAHRLVAGEMRLAALQQRDVRAGSPHVEGDEIALADHPRTVPASRDAARRPRQYGSGSQANRVLDGGDTAMRLHDEDAAGIAGRRQPLLEAAEIAREHRPHIGVDHGGAEALVLLDLRQHLRRERNVGRRQQTREQPARGLLVPPVPVGMEVADGDRLDLGPGQLAHGRLDRALVQRGFDGAVEADALAHVEPPRSRHQRDGRRHAQVVAVVLEPLAHLDDVPVTSGGEHAHGGALPLQQGIGGHRGPVHDQLGTGQQGARVEPELGGEETEAVEHADGGIGRRGRGLRERGAAVLVHRDQIGERPADVDADAEGHAHALPLRRGFEALSLVTRPFSRSRARAAGSRRRGSP